jgi:hypothetical protein
VWLIVVKWLASYNLTHRDIREGFYKPKKPEIKIRKKKRRIRGSRKSY